MTGYTVNDGNSGNNYTVNSTATVAGTITKAPLTVTANDATKIYGDANPAFTSRLLGFVKGEDETMAGVTGIAVHSTPGDERSHIGSYPITPAIGTLTANNYDFVSFNTGNLSVTPRNLSITGDNVVRFEDEPNPSPFKFSTNVGGLVNSDVLSNVDVTVPLESIAAKGGYVFSLMPGNASFASGLASNYTMNYTNGMLLVLPRPPKDVSGTSGTQIAVFSIEVNPEEEQKTTDELEHQQAVRMPESKPVGAGTSPLVLVDFVTPNPTPATQNTTQTTPVATTVSVQSLKLQPLMTFDTRLTSLSTNTSTNSNTTDSEQNSQ